MLDEELLLLELDDILQSGVHVAHGGQQSLNGAFGSHSLIPVYSFHRMRSYVDLVCHGYTV